MRTMPRRTVALLAVALFATAAATCPPPGFDSVANLNVKAFISQPWYAQQQMITAYQRENQLFCVRAVYQPTNPANLNAGLAVVNSARTGSVTGPLVGSTGSGASSSSNSLGSFGITAFPTSPLAADGTSASPRGASKLAVGPSFLASLYNAGFRGIFGPYWIVAVGSSSDPALGYDWAIVSGGPPKNPTAGGCTAGPVNPTLFDVNGAGLWLFSRKPVDPEATAAMRAEAARLGFDLSVLKPVAQAGCSYPAVPPPSGGGGGGMQLGPKKLLLPLQNLGK